ncbi:hypothetical protein IWQ60_002685 [Tieghemiomyces parasiticus]|uniref:Chitin-binding type-4 domain-containing protein n=1 Tax=Tieghemiomyces parasiticus TaxID=78921 RepID=A0A9W8AAV4_9FUNG|nr:hypothetical protein IWQ60_002685 [Tieghemiomyces parasiticus]
MVSLWRTATTALAAVVLLAADPTAAHSLLHYPAPRGNLANFGTCGSGQGCKGPCDAPRSASNIGKPWFKPVTIQRGQELRVAWERNNHPGGFVRLAMVPIDQSDSWDAFNAHVVKHSCYEAHCGPDNPSDNTFGPGNGLGNGECWTTFTVPSTFADGATVTLQWMWYAGGVYYAQPAAGFGNYYNCADIIVQGGSPVDAGNTTVYAHPPFQGGDFANPNSNMCKYWSSNKYEDCTFGSRMPSPVSGDLLSQSLEPCARTGSMNGKPNGY